MSKTKIKTLISMFTIFITLFILTLNIFSYAWFSNNWSNGSITFETGETEVPDAYLWTYYSKNDGANDDEAGYIKSTLSKSNPGLAPISSVTRDDDTTYHYVLSSLQLGVVDNLVYLSEDNYCYVALVIDISKYGDECTIVFNENSDSNVQIYDKDGTEQTDNYLTHLSEINSSFINIEYGILSGSTVIDPDDDDFNVSFNSVSGTITFTENSILYLKLSTNLEAFAESSEILNDIIPCVFIFDYEFKVVLK